MISFPERGVLIFELVLLQRGPHISVFGIAVIVVVVV